MYKFLGILILPFTFVFVLETSINFFKNNSEQTYSIIGKDSNFIDVHKNFEIVRNLNNILNYYEKIEKISQTKIDLVSATFDKNIYDYSSAKINEIYSEKIIDKDFFIYPKKLISLKNNITKKNLNIIPTNSLQLISSDWKSMFSQKKIEFIETVLPLISYENQKILMERQRLFEIKDYLLLEKTLISKDIMYLRQIAKKYLIKTKNKHKIDILNELLYSINVIPNSIVLAQAANESGWGTSRFAKEFNALFGQYTYDEDNGIVPFEREEGKKHLVKHFSSFHKSVESYFKNINTHYAYKRFREVRSQINQNDLNQYIKLLTQTLDVYAEDESYVKTINSIIDSNNFNQFNLKIQTFINS